MMTTEEFLPYLKTVGTGPKRNRDLTKDEMKAASIEVFDEFIKQKPLKNSIEFGYPYDGKVKNPYLITLVAKYLQEFDINLSLHGDLLQPAKGGITLKEVCDNTHLTANTYYYDRETYFPELHAFSDTRAKLGLRSSFNTIEKLLNITQSDTAIIGAFHKPFVEKYIKLFKDRYKKLIIIKGNEGTPEIVKEIKVDPKDFGISYEKSREPISLERSLALTHNPSDELLKLAKLNAAVILFLTGKVSSIEDGFNAIYF
jgi:anthranilate phosphoribosyltransferase